MKIVFLGGGNMATALIGGLTGKGFAGADITVIETHAENRERLSRDFGAVTRATAAEAGAEVAAADVVVLAVKPQSMKAAVAPLVPHLKGQLVVSIAAGLRFDALSRWLGGHAKIVRTMPNTPALVGAGVAGLWAAPAVSVSEREAASRILGAVGETVWIDDEAKMDAVTALSGSGPAYVFLFIEALQQAGAELGFDADTARQLAIGTVLGAAKLAADSPEPASVLRERVTSKGGTTFAALETMAAKGVKDGIVAGVHAANARGQELGEQLGQD